MNDQWFYALDGQQHGPVQREDLRSLAHAGILRPSDYVWSPGMTEWGLAHDVAGIFDQPTQPSPPPLPGIPKSAEADVLAKKIAGGLCGVLFGGFGVHKFVIGLRKQGMTMLLLSLCTFFVAFPVMQIIGMIEGIIYLAKTEEDFYRDYVVEKRGWF